MPGTGNAAGAAALLLTLVSADASAQVMDATYRGTLV